MEIPQYLILHNIKVCLNLKHIFIGKTQLLDLVHKNIELSFRKAPATS